MDIRVGLSSNDLLSRLHREVLISSPSGLVVAAQSDNAWLPVGSWLGVKAKDSTLISPQIAFACSRLMVKPEGKDSFLTLPSLVRIQANAGLHPSYLGAIELSAVGNLLRVILITDLETYVRGTLQSEIPGTYLLEAIKAQAVAARTYGLHPRLSHEKEGFNVCDSYLHCQYFAGITSSITPSQKQAIEQTKGEILTFADKPILALFSACAGGHTEDYQNCFSDPLTNKFPPDPLNCLTGVAEGRLPADFPSESGLRKLWHSTKLDLADSWSNQFRWQCILPAQAMEAQMHHVVSKLKEDPQFSPFIEAPSGGQFGQLQGFAITRRGVSGVAMEMLVKTSGGNWEIKKELTIRNLFKNSELHLDHLKSARMFFDHKFDKLGLLSELNVSGLGSGHGVGLQQTGAQGWAKRGKSYREILSHYYQGVQISKL